MSEVIDKTSVVHEQRDCPCDWCQKWGPLIARIRRLIGPVDREILTEFIEDVCCAEMDRDVALAKLAGDWPGWEAMKKFKPTPPADKQREER